jgi:hypothetical protein
MAYLHARGLVHGGEVMGSAGPDQPFATFFCPCVWLCWQRRLLLQPVPFQRLFSGSNLGLAHTWQFSTGRNVFSSGKRPNFAMAAKPFSGKHLAWPSLYRAYLHC